MRRFRYRLVMGLAALGWLAFGGATAQAQSSAPPTLEVCGQPLYFFGTAGQPQAAVAVLLAPPGGPLAELEVSVDVQHSAIGQLEVDLLAPDGTTLRLHDRQTLGLFDDDVILRYSDRGLPNGSLPYNSDCPMRPAGDGAGPLEDSMAAAASTSWGGLWTLVVRDVVYPGGSGQLASWCLRFFDSPQAPLPFGPRDFQWHWMLASYELSWTNTDAYDQIEVLVDGSPVVTLPGTATSHSLFASDALSHFVCVRATVGGEVVCREACGWVAPGSPSVSVCDSTPIVVDDQVAVATLAVGVAPVIGDVRVPLRLAHDEPRDVLVSLRSPQGTEVVLHDVNLVATPDLDLTFWDLGIVTPDARDCRCFERPDGPGGLVDFVGEVPSGLWELRVAEDDPSLVAELDEWCLEFFAESPPFPVAALQAIAGTPTGTIHVAWSNPVPYDGIEILLAGAPVAFVQGSATSHTLPPVSFAGTYTVCVRPEVGGYFGPATCVSVLVDIEPPLALTCQSAPGSGVATVEWVNPRVFDAIHVSIDGNATAILPGSATTYQTPLLGVGSVVEVCVRGDLQGVLTAVTCCLVPVVPAIDFDFEVCSLASQGIDNFQPNVTDTLTVGGDTEVAELEIDVAVRYLALSLVVIDVESPTGTVVRLHDLAGAGTRLQLTYSDHGVAAGATTHGCQCRMQPAGDGSGPLADALAEFQGEPAAGAWQLRVTPTFPLPGSLAGWCLRLDGTCPTPEPTDLTCTNVAGMVELTWQNRAVYDHVEVLRDGLSVAILGGAATFFQEPLPLGRHDYSVVGVLAGCGHPSGACRVAAGVTDVIFRGESPLGRVDSVFALEQALSDLGRSAAVVDHFDAATLASFGNAPQRLWLMLGTFPHNYVLTPADGVLLAELHTGDSGLDGTPERPPLPIYIEGNDVWGFDAPTAFAAYDGVENGTAARGDNSLTHVTGADTGLGLDLAGLQGGYFHDRVGNEQTDRLRATGTTAGFGIDAGGSRAAIAWTASAGGYGVATFYASTFAPVIAQSFELGGYSHSLPNVVGRYLTALQITNEDAFRRGDVDRNGALQLGDPIALLSYLFLGGATPPCLDAADFDDDGGPDVADVVGLLGYLFLSAAPPPAPGTTCGADPTSDGLAECVYPSTACP
ncbi:MAG: proprotein convertase P-domain-containing protein [Planctomycetota bacterium]